MNNAYRKEWSIIQNLFSPQQKLVQKIREGSKVRRWMSEAVTPMERLRALLPEKKISEIKATLRVNRSIQNKLSA
jgi:ketol-acid reductoisomerase